MKAFSVGKMQQPHQKYRKTSDSHSGCVYGADKTAAYKSCQDQDKECK